MYVPHKNDFTSHFGLAVANGEKDLLLTKDVNFIANVPNDYELSVKKLYAGAKKNPKIMRYLPKYSKTRVPNKTYLCNVINTLYPNSIRRLTLESRL